jgi:hypothetical protein
MIWRFWGHECRIEGTVGMESNGKTSNTKNFEIIRDIGKQVHATLLKSDLILSFGNQWRIEYVTVHGVSVVWA